MTQIAASAAVSGPASGGTRGWPFGASTLDVAAYGYVEEEFFLEGTATRYRPVPGTELGRDGHWQAEPAGSAPFKTRFIVYRPSDPARFNGTAVVTWNNVTVGHDLFGANSVEILEGGFALVCVTTQRVGIEGLPPVNRGLASWDPDRYGTLSIPSDDYSYDVFTQAALAVGPDRARQPVDPMGGLDVRRVVGQGASQSAGRLGTYVNAIQPLTRAFDGFILTIYFARGYPLEVGDAVVNINQPDDDRSAMDRLRGENLLRDDLGIPIFVVNSELEAIAGYDFRQPDSDTYRYWESAGTCHVSQQGRRARAVVLERDGVAPLAGAEGINALPMDPLYDAAFYHMQRWLTGEATPPIQPRVEFAGDPSEVVRDEHGIARGGIRLPQADVPLAQNSAIPLTPDIWAALGGSSHPFAREQVLALYGDQASFLANFEDAARAAEAAGVIRPREVAKLVSEAEASWPSA